jgi:hypothetical protein
MKIEKANANIDSRYVNNCIIHPDFKNSANVI